MLLYGAVDDAFSDVLVRCVVVKEDGGEKAFVDVSRAARSTSLVIIGAAIIFFANNVMMGVCGRAGGRTQVGASFSRRFTLDVFLPYCLSSLHKI